MKVLWITLESILPANTGGRIGVYKRLEQISKTEDIYLFYPYDNDNELTYVEELQKYCKEVHAYNRNKNKILGILKLWKYPFTVSSRVISEMENDIKKCIDDNHIDVINVDFPHMCACLENLNCDIPIVLNEHNIEWKVYKTIAKSHKNILKKLAYFVDSYRLKYYERNLFKKHKFSKVTFVSSKDMQFMIDNGMINHKQAVLIPVGADRHEIKHTTHKGINILFVGKMSYGPNVEAVTWFSKNVMPKLVKDEGLTNLTFYIVGKEPIDEVKSLEADHIVVTGMVDDVSEYYNKADLVVLPLKNGGGVKVKLLEAISYKKKIVSTSVGVEGTYYADHLIPVADDSDEFAKYCVDILNGTKFYPETDVYNYFELNYTWQKIGEKYLTTLYEIYNEERL